MEKLHADTAGLRKQMMVKHAELAALWKTGGAGQTAIQAKQKEFNALRDQVQEKMTALGLEVKKIAPDFDMGMGVGMGMGMGPGGYGQSRWWYEPRKCAAAATAVRQVARGKKPSGAEGPEPPFSRTRAARRECGQRRRTWD